MQTLSQENLVGATVGKYDGKEVVPFGVGDWVGLRVGAKKTSGS